MKWKQFFRMEVFNIPHLLRTHFHIRLLFPSLVLVSCPPHYGRAWENFFLFWEPICVPIGQRKKNYPLSRCHWYYTEPIVLSAMKKVLSQGWNSLDLAPFSSKMRRTDTTLWYWHALPDWWWIYRLLKGRFILYFYNISLCLCRHIPT